MSDLNEELEERGEEQPDETAATENAAENEAESGFPELGAEIEISEPRAEQDENTGKNDENAGEEEKTSFLSEAMGWTSALLFALAAVLAINLFFLRSITVSGDSMNDTLQDKDKVFATNLFYTPDRGDIVIIQADKLKLQGTNLYGETIIKRVVGVAGDRIRVDFIKGLVYINDQVIEEDYIKEPVRERYAGWIENDREYTVPDNCVFVMGDNRNRSNDSRNLESVGFIDTDLIMGKAILRYAPFSKFKWL